MAIWQPSGRQACQSQRGEKERWLNSGLTSERGRRKDGEKDSKRQTETKKQVKDNEKSRLRKTVREVGFKGYIDRFEDYRS